MLIRVDAGSCDGHALCAAVASQVFEVDEDTGRNEMGEFDAAESLRAAALRGAAACPERAITVEPQPGA